MPAKRILGGIVLVAQLALIAHILSWLRHGLGIDSLHNQTWRSIVHFTERVKRNYISTEI